MDCATTNYDNFRCTNFGPAAHNYCIGEEDARRNSRRYSTPLRWRVVNRGQIVTRDDICPISSRHASGKRYCFTIISSHFHSPSTKFRRANKIIIIRASPYGPANFYCWLASETPRRNYREQRAGRQVYTGPLERVARKHAFARFQVLFRQ